MIQQTDLRIISLMIEKIDRLLEIGSRYTDEEIKADFVISDSIQYEFEKLYFDSTRLSAEFHMTHPNFPLDKLRGMRNRIAHDYTTVQLSILIDTIRNDLSPLKKSLEEVIGA